MVKILPLKFYVKFRLRGKRVACILINQRKDRATRRMGEVSSIDPNTFYINEFEEIRLVPHPMQSRDIAEIQGGFFSE